MKVRGRYIFFVLVAILSATSLSFAQNADNSTPIRPRAGSRCVEEPYLCEQLDKLRIEQNKKEFQAMIARGDEALKISEELEKAVAISPRLSQIARVKLESLEKIVKKIRSELGGDDDDENNSGDAPAADADAPRNETRNAAPPKDVVTALRSLKESAVQLVSELKKTTRFTISAAAINTSNAVLRLTRVLKFWR